MTYLFRLLAWEAESQEETSLDCRDESEEGSTGTLTNLSPQMCSFQPATGFALSPILWGCCAAVAEVRPFRHRGAYGVFCRSSILGTRPEVGSRGENSCWLGCRRSFAVDPILFARRRAGGHTFPRTQCCVHTKGPAFFPLVIYDQIAGGPPSTTSASQCGGRRGERGEGRRASTWQVLHRDSPFSPQV